MIGNDIVDLSAAKSESNWKRKGFLDKIFTKNEQLLILESSNPELMVWNLWTRKEAAYKIYNRQTGIRAYIPLKLECCDVFSEIGKVIYEDRIYFTNSEVTKDYIHTVAVSKINNIEKIIIVDNSTIVTKIDGIPFTKFNEIVSVSHHGNFKRIVMLP